MVFFKNYWKKIMFVLLSFLFIWIGFDYLMGNNVIQQKSSNLFSIAYIILISYIIIALPKKCSVVVYLLAYLPLFAMCIVQYFHFNIIGTFFGIVDTNNAAEGLSFINYIWEYFGTKIICFIVGGIILPILTVIFIIKTEHLKLSKKVMAIEVFMLIVVIILFSFLHQNAIKSLGKYEKENMWFEENTYRNVYEKFNIRNVCMQLCSIYEYTIRDVGLYIKNNISIDIVSKVKDVNNYFEDNKRSNKKNDYTGVLKDQNLIVIQLEGIDTWMVNEDTMPTLTYLSDHGLNFTRRYAPSFGGGKTQNSEYAINTGLYIPVNGYNIYNSYKNNFDYSLPNIFKDNGYIANSIHFNYGYYYSREKMHKSLGYDNHYSLLDLNIGDGRAYWFNDVHLADNDEAYKLIVPDTNKKFLSYVITMSGHGAFNEDYPLCEGLDKEECVYYSAKLTDEFLKILLQRLDEDEKLDNTTLVLISDHYAYSYGDDEILELKGLSEEDLNNEVNRTPFIIWNKVIPSDDIDTLIDTADVLPTIINLFGFKVDFNNYLGTDVFSSSHEEFVYFKDHSYISDDKNNKDLSKIVSQKIDINDNMVIANYYNNK